MIRWGPVDCEKVAAPGPISELLTRAIALEPDNPALHVKLAGVHLDRFDFGAAAAALEIALRLDPAAPHVPARLARCYNVLGRHADALAVLAETGEAAPQYDRGIAFAGLGLPERAENEYRALLKRDPRHHHACWKLCRLLRDNGRAAETLAICQDLSDRGVGHTQLLYDWGLALALTGEEARSRAILFDEKRVVELQLPVPAGFADMESFNAVLAEEILSNPYKISDFPTGEEANRGSARVHHLLAGRRTALIRLLLDMLQECVAGYPASPAAGFDPWARARPSSAHLKAWGLIQRGGDYEAWHTHRGGWLSGVYYIDVPETVSAEGDGPGCIEYGAPPALAKAKPGYVKTWRYAPEAGSLLLAPSHYPHRTIPTGADGYRLSFAFDVVPDV